MIDLDTSEDVGNIPLFFPLLYRKGYGSVADRDEVDGTSMQSVECIVLRYNNGLFTKSRSNSVNEALYFADYLEMLNTAGEESRILMVLTDYASAVQSIEDDAIRKWDSLKMNDIKSLSAEMQREINDFYLDLVELRTMFTKSSSFLKEDLRQIDKVSAYAGLKKEIEDVQFIVNSCVENMDSIIDHVYAKSEISISENSWNLNEIMTYFSALALLISVLALVSQMMSSFSSAVKLQ